MHIKRWLTGIVGTTALIFLIGAGPRWPFYGVLFLASIAGLIEFYGMTASGLPKFVKWSIFVLTFTLFFVFATRQLLLAPAIIFFWVLAPMTYYMLTHSSPDDKWTNEICSAVLGPVYVVIPLCMLVMIDMSPKGNVWIFFLLAVVFATDTGAFYFGRTLGKHKLHKKISPNKTWEGAVGGLFSSIIAGYLFLRISDLHDFGLSVFILVIFLSVFSQIGDLAESMLKRNHHVKDSGKILPGHGGMLDRIDGLLFAIPVLYIFLNWMGM
jgi:phosphatidate cytidylyltransferase